MKSWLLVLALLGGGEQEKGVALYEQGLYEEAIAAFRRAEEADGASAELSYNLALALWKSGQLDAAETEAERAATLSDGRLSHLRDGVLGNLRFAAAKSKEAEDPQGALAVAEQARDHYLRGSLAAKDAPELARNLERSLRLIDELRKKIDEQKKEENKDDKKGDDKKDDQKQEEKKDEKKDQDQQEQKKEDQQKQDEKKDQQQGEEQKQGDQQQDKPQDGKGEEKPEPQPQPQPQDGDKKDQERKPQPAENEQKEGEAKPPSASQQAAPGEHDPNKQLTPEQAMQLQRELEKFDAQLQKLRAMQRAQRPKVEKDW